ncbi:undecaprenyldiphospho-muramoylpentapeptide beta-N-acetylglucosaminyltransferase [Gluconobacter kanchanaburiensis]|uniref:UDP-N-acetylglucosamine--N-acetylmuramyl-(pentapeptide) pyrophosphoryl-undecaprenol N-acetylglucosamine transferase n=1 Tax=Gluconobacter kanchanaburiensis NBRC 103587 TaxID=1307948 RepID=A0A511BCG9_9PROT|nr:undecaprenyldiphospho-muramoylpentapeptide beta-N-acetylglucosaminyltransferase [Gluconobacter kanchanaburiensis]MBF0862970.1 undecaprenyldiphospho-muramoylpentapeptide beta-N-acetylglucosaminyltransferase [Gluconobacter kanchanaburiensis]GBR70623.1 undecaprenyldiphospho-muramoylpentapeptide beta-N- acetylglucosaminyltransferase [Gluconobacter kanchanaburiensis NBRC 103587]GEK97293.1 UDP-N-acetylglucosamine--N-acetylmuramyl-(pentapeptide) pyrophosphoryl-undecaprenol N-acetylglucosamine transf
MSRPIVIAAGGTGGHFFPAEAVASVLAERGHDLVLMTDARHGKRETGLFKDRPQYVLDGAGVAGKGLRGKIRGVLALMRGMIQAHRVLKSLDAAAVVGFGGYPSIPPLTASRVLPTTKRPKMVIHEGNAVLGQANAFLSRFKPLIATSYAAVAKLPLNAQTTLTGMPVRAGIEALYGRPYEAPTDRIHLLIWGGSLGARVFSEIVPRALAELPVAIRGRLTVTQQIRTEDLERVRLIYKEAGIEIEAAPFFTDVPACLEKAHLVIGRAGGSSVAELTMAGRPSILVPLPIAASDEQGANAQALVDTQAAWMIRQNDFTPPVLTALLTDLFSNPEKLEHAANAAHHCARPHAAAKVADLIESTLS